LEVLLLQISAEVEVPHVNSEIVAIDSSMGKLINVPENFKHAKILKTHQLLLLVLNTSD